MLPNKAKAKAIIDLDASFQVIPVNKDPHGKNLFNFKWSEIIINKENEQLLDSYWYGESDRQVAVLSDEYGVIDLDRKNGKDGWSTMEAHGLELPYTPVFYDTPNNGRHYLYRFPKGTTKSAPITLGKTKLEGIDRQVGNGIFVWYGDIPSRGMLESVPDAPDWALGREFEPMRPEYRKILDALIPGHIDHEAMVKTQYAIVSEGTKGIPGYVEAMAELRDLYLAGHYNTPEYQKEWQDALDGLEARLPDIQAKVDAQAAQKPVEKDFESLVSEQMLRMEVLETAKKRRLEAVYSGTTFWNWDDLENVQVEYVLQDLLYRGSLNGLVGRSQIGKTFVMVSMLGSMALGIDWMGLKTEKQRILFVAGEGTGGIAARFKDWARAYGHDWETLKQNLKVVTDVDIYLDISVEQMQRGAAEFQPDMIVLDTMSATATIENENDAANMAELLANAKRIYPGAIVLFAHHPSNATKAHPNPAPRGSSVFYSNADNIMTLTVDKTFAPNKPIDDYTNGKKVHFLTLSTDFEEHGGKSKEGMPVTIKGLYLREFEAGRVVLDQTQGSRQHSHNTFIDDVMKFLDENGRKCTVKSFWAAADEMGLKDSTDPYGGWKSDKGARTMLESATERGYLIETKGSGTTGTTYSKPVLTKWEF